MQFVNSSYSIKKLDGIQDKTILELIPKTANHAIYYTNPTTTNQFLQINKSNDAANTPTGLHDPPYQKTD